MKSKKEKLIKNLQRGKYNTVIQDYQSFLAKTILRKIHSKGIQNFIASIIFLSVVYLLVILEHSNSINSFGSYFITLNWLRFGRGLFYTWIFVGFLIIAFFTEKFYNLLIDDFIILVKDGDTLLLEKWLLFFSNRWIIFLSSLCASIFFALIRSYGFNFFVFASNFIGWIVVTYTFIFFLFPICLSKIHLRLNWYDPANSKIVKKLLSLANQLTLTMVIAYNVGLIIIINRGNNFYIGFDLVYFYLLGPVLILIASFHYILSKKITDTKFEALDSLDKNISNKINKKIPVDLENINQLIDYRNKLADTQNSTLDITNIVRLLEIVIIPLIFQLFGILTR